MISKYGDSVLEVVFKIERLLIVLRVKGKDKKRAKIVEEGAREDLI